MDYLAFFREGKRKLINLKEASVWASQYLNRKVTISNISYLIQYGRIKRYGTNENPLVNISELKEYTDEFKKERPYENL